MKRILLLLFLFSFTQLSLKASTSLQINEKDPLASEVMILIAGTNKMISLKDYLNLTPQAYTDVTGKKMKLGQKIDLSISKYFIKKMIRKDGTVDIQKTKKRGFFTGWRWHWGGFALGFFLSFLGVIVTLVFKDDHKWDRFWTALHTALWIAVIGAIIIAIFPGAFRFF